MPRAYGLTLDQRVVVMPSGCHEFQGARHEFGYGIVNIGGRTHKAHRLAYELWVGPIPEGQFVLHRCDNPPCVNPEHLFLGTHTDNMRDAHAKGRGPTGRRFRIGHAYHSHAMKGGQ